MTIVNFPIPSTLADDEPALASDASLAFRHLEGLFQSDVMAENLAPGEVLRGQSFRRNGLTEVFSRKTRSEFWSVFPGTGTKSYDLPGGALRFRLRHPADVLVFFTASIYRLNKPDSIRSAYGGAFYASNVDFSWVINALWEGGDSEPGEHYIQAQSILRAQATNIDKTNTSRGIFLPWKIKSVDGVDSSSNPLEPNPVPLSESRVIGPAVGASDTGRLQAGWHNIRHVAYWSSSSELGAFGTSPVMVMGNTELVVVADYGPGEDAAQVARGLRDEVKVDNFSKFMPEDGPSGGF